MAEAQGWEPLLLGGLSLLDGLLPTARCARAIGLWKLETTTLMVGLTIYSTVVIGFCHRGRIGTASLMRLMRPLLVGLPDHNVYNSCRPDGFRM